MNNVSTSPANHAAKQPGVLILVGVLVLALALLFSRSFIHNQVLFSNDGPLGAISSQSSRTTLATCVSVWQDLNWLGNEGITPDASVSALLAMVLTPLNYAKFASPIGLLILGLCAWVFFRQMRLSSWACVIGAVAATLNSDFFSTSCWGIVPQPICVGACFLSLAALARIGEGSAARSWIRVILAGFAVGMAVVQGADVGALFSLFVAAYVLYQAVFLDGKPSPTGRKLGFAMTRVVIVALFAALIATHTLTSLVGTQITNVAGNNESPAAHRWWLTEWSLPKVEILQAAVPGIFGFRQIWHMYDSDQPQDDQYWGLIGENTSAGGDMWRLSGTGLYAGVFVLVVALWAVFQSLRKSGSPFTLLQSRAIKFWSLVLVATALLGFGRFAPFCQLFYALPFTGHIRNPTKFLHVFSWALVILFGYGMHGLAAAFMQNSAARLGGVSAGTKNWWANLRAPDRAWLVGCLIALGAAVFGRLIYGLNSAHLLAYLQTVGIPADQAPGVARFSLHTVDWFLLFLLLTVALLALIFSGAFAGPRAKWGGSLIVLFLLIDLGRADAPWIVYYNTDNKYISDPITRFLASKPYEHRVSFLPFQISNPQTFLMQSAYFSQWKQHIYPYNNIQCAESIQEPRVGEDKQQFEAALGGVEGLLRKWELLNVRYILGPAVTPGPGGKLVTDDLNQGADPVKRRFVTATFPDGAPVRFNFVPKSPEFSQSMDPVSYNVVPDPNGLLQVLEFTGALPRASLYSNWQVDPDDASTLALLAGKNFDPHQLVIVSNSIPPPNPVAASQPAGTVSINTNYEPRRVELEADVKVPSVLLLCDRYNPKWVVSVDGQPAELLRCNFIERGVLLQPGKHTVVFRFTGSIATFAISFTAVVLALALCGWLAFTERSGPVEYPDPAPLKPQGSPPVRSTAANPAPARSGSDPRKNKPRKG
jgi:hypothetical protein